MDNKIELAWAAGFFDGEGNVSYLVKRKSEPKLTLTVVQVGTTCLKRFRQAVGSKREFYNYNPTGPYAGHIQQRFTLQNFEEIQITMIRLWPYLSRPKKDQYIEKVREYLLQVKEKKKINPRFGKMRNVDESYTAHMKRVRLRRLREKQNASISN